MSVLLILCFSKPMRPIDVCKNARSVNFNEPVYAVDICKLVLPDDVCKLVCPVDIPKPFFVNYWNHLIFVFY